MVRLEPKNSYVGITIMPGSGGVAPSYLVRVRVRVRVRRKGLGVRGEGLGARVRH